MPVYFLPRQALGSLIESLAKTNDVIAPVKKGDAIFLDTVTSADGVQLEEGLTVIPPKDVFFPQTQTLMRFKTAPKLEIDREPATSGRPVVLFGVRPCDIRSFFLLDKVFAEGQFIDAPYVERRANTTVVGLGCTKAWPTCFCTSVGASPAEAPGADVFLFSLGEGGYSLEVMTDKGQALMDGSGLTLKELDPAAKAQLEAAKTAAVDSITLKVDAAGVSEAMDKLFESEFWDSIAEKCMGCGVCSYVCPTCHCFDIEDESSGSEGTRIRCWDCCMFSDFTRMAGGHNPRPAKKERVRQRFMHKLRYFKANNDELACVGCGRCLVKCPAGMDITEVIEEVKARV